MSWLDKGAQFQLDYQNPLRVASVMTQRKDRIIEYMLEGTQKDHLAQLMTSHTQFLTFACFLGCAPLSSL